MFFSTQFVYLIVSLALANDVAARERWLERDGRALNFRFTRRRFGQEQPAVIQKLSQACAGQVCGVLAGEAVTPLLAAQGECTQQDQADKIIDAAQQFDATTKANMIQLAIEYRQVEKNTPPDFSTNPPALRNSVFCQKAPKNPELNGLVQAQDPANDPNLFFDPATQATVTLGSQPNTTPFGGAGAAPAPVNNSGNTDGNSSTGGNNTTGATGSSNVDCPPNVTVTVTGGGAQATAAPASAPTTGNGNANQDGNTGNIGDFGICSVPQIDFAVGFDNRKETSFEPADLDSYTHGSAQNIDIITQFICDTLTNKCKADQTAKDICQQAKAAASAATKGTGGQADAFNKVFGINTNLNAIPSVDNQGNQVPGTGAPAPATGNGNANQTGTTSSTGDFGICSVPEIDFAVGFDNRKETSFEPADLDSYAHGSAQNIDIITQFICDTLTNKCKADQTAKDICQQARAAASAATKGTGGQADAFNKVFGINTNLNAIPSVDNQGNQVPGTGAQASTKRSLRRRRGIGSQL